MKGIILNLSSPNKRTSKSLTKTVKKDLRVYLHSYGLIITLTVTLFLGMTVGTLAARSADKEVLNGLDFLFSTNFESRGEQSVFSTFAASFTSYFFFFAAIFMCGLSAWGVVGIPLIIFLKGFGTGICAGYLYQTYSLKGVGFYLLVMLVGIITSSLAFIMQGRDSIRVSINVWNIISKRRVSVNNMADVSANKGVDFVGFLITNSYYLIAVAIAALIDALLNALFAGLFQFT